MIQRTTNSLNMIDGTLKYMNNNKKEWDKEDDIVESVDYITNRKTQIDTELGQVLEKQTGGITAELYAGLNKAIDQAYKVGGRIALYARKAGNLVLLKEVDFAKTELDDGKFKEIIDRLKLIAKRGSENLANLDKYKIKQADIDTLNTAIAAIEEKPADRKSTTAGRIESNAAIPTLVSEILKKLQEMDNEIEFLCENEEFKREYFAVRRTDDVRGRGKGKKTAEEGSK